MSEIVLPDRAQALVDAEAITEERWALVEAAIRPGIRGPYLNKAGTALDAGLNAAAVEYLWSAVEPTS